MTAGKNRRKFNENNLSVGLFQQNSSWCFLLVLQVAVLRASVVTSEKNASKETRDDEMACLEDAGLHVSVERILHQLCVKKEMNDYDDSDEDYSDDDDDEYERNLMGLDHNGIIHRNNNNNNDDNDDEDHSDDDADKYEALERNLMSLLQADPSVASRRYRVQHHGHESDHSLIESSSSPPSPSHLPNEEGFLLLHHLCVTVTGPVPVPSL